jgi:SPP1 family predicted phage head-tail adaptor
MPNLADRKREKVDVLTPSYGSDNQGGRPPTYTVFASVWGEVQEEQGAENIFQGQAYGTQKIKVTIRFINGVNRTMRIKYGNKIYGVVAVRNKDMARKELEIFCIEAQPKGSE